ncbi:MAG: hypothetical protein HY538_00100 [Deltaproteobacteria bacterium]|nr:hypothetical protein [Deltaproteobacteria bacterium]
MWCRTAQKVHTLAQEKFASPKKEAAARRHMEHCPSCQKAVENFENSLSLYTQTRQNEIFKPRVPGLLETLRERIEREETKKIWFPRWAKVGASFAIVLLFFVGIWTAEEMRTEPEIYIRLSAEGSFIQVDQQMILAQHNTFFVTSPKKVEGMSDFDLVLN